MHVYVLLLGNEDAFYDEVSSRRLTAMHISRGNLSLIKRCYKGQFATTTRNVDEISQKFIGSYFIEIASCC